MNVVSMFASCSHYNGRSVLLPSLQFHFRSRKVNQEAIVNQKVCAYQDFVTGDKRSQGANDPAIEWEVDK